MRRARHQGERLLKQMTKRRRRKAMSSPTKQTMPSLMMRAWSRTRVLVLPGTPSLHVMTVLAILAILHLTAFYLWHPEKLDQNLST